MEQFYVPWKCQKLSANDIRFTTPPIREKFGLKPKATFIHNCNLWCNSDLSLNSRDFTQCLYISSLPLFLTSLLASGMRKVDGAKTWLIWSR